MSIYCVYLTIYRGNKLPPFYIGSTSLENISKGYHGSVASKKFKLIWKTELKENPELFQTKIIKTFENRTDAYSWEEKIHKKLNVLCNNLYINQSMAYHTFTNYGRKISFETSKKFSKRVPWNKGKKNIYSENTLQKMRSHRRGKKLKPLSDETKAKLSIPNPKKGNSGDKNGMFGKTHTDEVKKGLSENATKRFKGKTYEEIYGVEKAMELKRLRSENMRKMMQKRRENNLTN